MRGVGVQHQVLDAAVAMDAANVALPESFNEKWRAVPAAARPARVKVAADRRVAQRAVAAGRVLGSVGFHLPLWAPGASQDYQLSLGGSTAARLSFVASFP